MDTCKLLALSAFTGLLIHSTSYATSVLVTGTRKQVLNSSTAEKESVPEKCANGYSGSDKVFIPDLLARWPWPRHISPHFDMVGRESTAWVTSLGAFSPRAQHAFDRGEFSLLGGLAYPNAKKEHVRAGCDLMQLVFFVDEHSDAADPSEAGKQKDIIMDALRNPHKPRPKGEWVGGEVARQFWKRTIQNATEQSQKRFIQAFDEYLGACLEQSFDRNENHIRDIKSYIKIRRYTIGAATVFALLELGLNIPDEVMSHPAIQEMYVTATEMICIGNDLTSYNYEQFREDDTHNIVRIVMNEFGTDVNGGMLWAQDFHTKCEKKFHAAMAALPEWEEPLNSQVKEYCDGLGNWVRANYDWSFESGRYFGYRGIEIQKERWMTLMPKECEHGRTEVGPVLVDSSLL